MKQLTVVQWVNMFKQIRLTEAQMAHWHGIFEQNYPDVHQAFLEWLQLDAQQIKDIRAKYQ